MQLLLLHGFRGNHLGLRDVAKFLRRKGFETYVPDLPPMSKYPLDKYDPEHYAKWIANYILEKKLDRPVLIGHSMGSIIAAATAEKYPELINQKIIFLAPISVTPPKFIIPVVPLSVVLPNSLISHITTRYVIIKKGKKTYRDIVDLSIRCASKYTSRRDILKAAIFSETHSISDFTFDRDALFIAGQPDRLCSEDATRTLADKLNAKAEFIPGTGHLLNYEEPSIVADHIADFLGDPSS